MSQASPLRLGFVGSFLDTRMGRSRGRAGTGTGAGMGREGRAGGSRGDLMALGEHREHRDDAVHHAATLFEQPRLANAEHATGVEDGRALGRGTTGHPVEPGLLRRHHFSCAFCGIRDDGEGGPIELITQVGATAMSSLSDLPRDLVGEVEEGNAHSIRVQLFMVEAHGRSSATAPTELRPFCASLPASSRSSRPRPCLRPRLRPRPRSSPVPVPDSQPTRVECTNQSPACSPVSRK